MELVRGVNARALARRPSPPTCDQATRIVGQVAETLALADEHNMAYRLLADAVDRALEHDPDARQSPVAELRDQLLAAHGSPRLAQSKAA